MDVKLYYCKNKTMPRQKQINIPSTSFESAPQRRNRNNLIVQVPDDDFEDFIISPQPPPPRPVTPILDEPIMIPVVDLRNDMPIIDDISDESSQQPNVGIEADEETIPTDTPTILVPAVVQVEEEPANDLDDEPRPLTVGLGSAYPLEYEKFLNKNLMEEILMSRGKTHTEALEIIETIPKTEIQAIFRLEEYMRRRYILEMSAPANYLTSTLRRCLQDPELGDMFNFSISEETMKYLNGMVVTQNDVERRVLLELNDMMPGDLTNLQVPNLNSLDQLKALGIRLVGDVCVRGVKEFVKIIKSLKTTFKAKRLQRGPFKIPR